MDKKTVWIGFDPREADGFAVAKTSIRDKGGMGDHVPIHGLDAEELRSRGHYRRHTTIKEGRLFDITSNMPMSTEFALTRFLVPWLAETGWAVFSDCDVLYRRRIDDLFAMADPRYAVQVVKHDYTPASDRKMDNQVQTAYPRKNWSSVMLFNCDHRANKHLTPALVERLPGLKLHQFEWLKDEEIGALPPEWNWLVGYSDRSLDPAIVHFTDGLPSLPAHAHDPYSDEWRATLRRWSHN